MRTRSCAKDEDPDDERLYSAICLLPMLAGVAGAGTLDPGRWADYLDFAYVYSSADSETLNARLKQYGNEAGISLDDYMVGYLGAGSRTNAGLGDDKIRRKAIGFLLQYLVTREPRMIERSSDTIAEIQDEGTNFEARYWYHYILAHRALEKGDAMGFVHQNLEMWLNVVIPMESAFDTFETLSLSQSANSGFVAALPYVFENISRLIVIRSQEMALNRDLDALAAVVRMLHSDRVGAHPDVIPEPASSAAYLDRIVSRLDGPESDAGSLTFTLALFEASKYHDRARALLASEGFSAKTLKAIGVASGAYQVALAPGGYRPGQGGRHDPRPAAAGRDLGRQAETRRQPAGEDLIRHRRCHRGLPRALRIPRRGRLAERRLQARRPGRLPRHHAHPVGGDPGDQPQLGGLLSLSQCFEPIRRKRRLRPQRCADVRAIPGLLQGVCRRHRVQLRARLGLFRRLRVGSGLWRLLLALLELEAHDARAPARHAALPHRAQDLPLRPLSLGIARQGPRSARQVQRLPGPGPARRRAGDPLAARGYLDRQAGAPTPASCRSCARPCPTTSC